MIRNKSDAYARARRLPRMRGDDPHLSDGVAEYREFAPHARG